MPRGNVSESTSNQDRDNRPTEWHEWSVSEAHQWLRAQLGSASLHSAADLPPLDFSAICCGFGTLHARSSGRRLLGIGKASVPRWTRRLSPGCQPSFTRLKAHPITQSSGGRGARSLRRRPRSEGGRDGTFADGSRAAGSAACGNRLPGCAAAPRVRPGGVALVGSSRRRSRDCRQARLSSSTKQRNRRGWVEPTHHSRLTRVPKKRQQHCHKRG